MGLAVRRRPIRRRRRLIVFFTLSTAFLVLAHATPIFEPSTSRLSRSDVGGAVAGTGTGRHDTAEGLQADAKQAQIDSMGWDKDAAGLSARGTPTPAKDGGRPVANNIKQAALKSWDHGQIISDLNPISSSAPSHTPESPIDKTILPPVPASNNTSSNLSPTDALAFSEKAEDMTDTSSKNVEEHVNGAKPKISYGGQHSSVGVTGGSKKSSAAGGKAVTVPVPVPIPDVKAPAGGVGGSGPPGGALPPAAIAVVAAAAAPVQDQLGPTVPSPWGPLLTNYGSLTSTDTATTNSPHTGGAMNETMSTEGTDEGSSNSQDASEDAADTSTTEGDQGGQIERNGSSNPTGTAPPAEGQNTPNPNTNTNANTDSAAASTPPPDANTGTSAGSAAPKRGIFIKDEDNEGFYFLSRRSRQLLDLPHRIRMPEDDLEQQQAEEEENAEGGTSGRSSSVALAEQEQQERRRTSMIAIRQLMMTRHHGQISTKRSLLSDHHQPRSRKVERSAIK
ncbi:hypothetical protein CF326_g3918 [Tilletia indica]|nr:hypothetical protein CF326_g3918 [Tilletia indica]